MNDEPGETAAPIETMIAWDLLARQLWDEAGEVTFVALELLGDQQRPELRAEILLAMAEVCLGRGDTTEAIEQLRAVEEISRSRRAAATLS